MIFELRTYDLRPGDAQRYTNLFANLGREIITRHLPMVGYYLTETGRLNRLIHLWRYEDLADRARRRSELYRDADWLRDFIPHGLPLLQSQCNQLWIPTPGTDAADVKAMRTSALAPGELLRPILMIKSPVSVPDESKGDVLASLVSLTGAKRHLCLEAFPDQVALQQRLLALQSGEAATDILQPCAFSPLR